MPVPYAEYVGDNNPLELMVQTLDDYHAVASGAPASFWQEPWKPGKWTFREIMIHVAQWEAIFGYRLTCAVSIPNFEIQAVDQDPLLTRTAAIEGPAALAGFDRSPRMNLGVFRSLAAAARA